MFSSYIKDHAFMHLATKKGEEIVSVSQRKTFSFRTHIRVCFVSSTLFFVYGNLFHKVCFFCWEIEVSSTAVMVVWNPNPLGRTRDDGQKFGECVTTP
jgi:hypothetical protein